MQKSYINNHMDVSRYFLTFFLLAGLFIMLLPSCEHDPFPPIGPDPIDAMGMDTMDIDTMDEDTLGIPCDADVVYFNKDLLPILKSNCAKSGCHDVTTHEEDIVLDNFQNVMASGIVKPYDVSNSDLYEVITETDPDKRMPEPPNQKLTADQIALISKWIQQGAKDLTCEENIGLCDTVSVSYSSYIAPVFTAYCVGCHSGAAPSGNISLNSHSGVQDVALNGSLLGAITWTSGYDKQMPKGSGKLSDCRINKIKAWINDGAPNN